MNDNLDKIGPRQRFMIAGLGGVMPVLLSLVVIDLQTLLLNVTILTIVSYLIRVFALYTVGGVVGWLNRDERDPIKLFQLGIAAPALITAAINGGRITLPDAPTEPSQTVSWHILSQAYAETENQALSLKRFSMPEETPVQQIYRGLFGMIPKNVWFVIVGSHLNQEAAEKQAEKVRRGGFPAEVFAPYGGNPYYAVVIGWQITLAEARKLQKKAIEAGLPSDTYLWTFPQR